MIVHKGKYIEIAMHGTSSVSDIVRIDTDGTWNLIFTNNSPVSIQYSVNEFISDSVMSSYRAPNYPVVTSMQCTINSIYSTDYPAILNSSIWSGTLFNSGSGGAGTYYNAAWHFFGQPANSTATFNVNRYTSVGRIVGGNSGLMLTAWCSLVGVSPIEGGTFSSVYGNSMVFTGTGLLWFVSLTQSDRIKLLKIKYLSEKYQYAICPIIRGYYGSPYLSNNLPYDGYNYENWASHNATSSYTATKNFDTIHTVRQPVYSRGYSNTANTTGGDINNFTVRHSNGSTTNLLLQGGQAKGGSNASTGAFLLPGDTLTCTIRYNSNTNSGCCIYANLNTLLYMP